MYFRLQSSARVRFTGLVNAIIQRVNSYILKCCRVVVELMASGNLNSNMNINDLICVLFIIVMSNHF